MGFQFLDWKALFYGRVRNTASLTVPGGLITTLIGFEMYVIAYVLWVLLRTNLSDVVIPATVDRIDIFDCYVSLTCAPRSSDFNRVYYDSDNINGTFTIDGRNTLRCSVDICVSSRNASKPLQFRLSDSVLLLEDVRSADNSANVSYSISVVDNPIVGSAGFSVNKVFFGSKTAFSDIYVNMTKGIVTFINTVAKSAAVHVGFGTAVVFNTFRDRPFVISADVEDNNYCVAQALSVLTPGSCVNVTTNETSSSSSNHTYSFTTQRCALYASWTSPAVGVSAFATTHFDIYANALYINHQQQSTNATESRIAGEGMSRTPTIDPTVVADLKDTQTWKATSLIDDYVQGIEMVTPGLGIIFLHASRSILLEIGPEWLAFYSAFALRPHYRRLYTLLSHYRCRAEPTEPFDNPQSLTNLVLERPAQYREFSFSDMRRLLEQHIDRDDMYSFASTIQALAGEQKAIVAFSTPETEWTNPNDLLGNRWRYYTATKRSESAGVEVRPLTNSPVGLAIQGISTVTSLVAAFFVWWLLFLYRNEILQSFMLIKQRELLRNAVKYTDNCPYHYFFGSLTISAWIAFRICMYLAQDIFAKVQRPMFVRFLAFYFRKSGGDNDPADRGVTMKLTKSTAVGAIMSQFESWALLRYTDTTEVSYDTVGEHFDQFGGRRVMDERYVVRRLTKRAKVKAVAQFELEYTALQTFYDITGDDADEVLLDQIFLRALMEDDNITVEEVARKLRQWNLPVEKKPVETVIGVCPQKFTKECLLSDEELVRLVEILEYNCSSFPSWGYVEFKTSGPSSSGSSYYLRRLIRIMWTVIEASMVTAITFAPLMAAYLIAMPLDYEHARYSTTTSILKVRELQYAMTDIAAPRPQNPVSSTIFATGLILVVLGVIEPFLVWSTFRHVATFHVHVEIGKPGAESASSTTGYHLRGRVIRGLKGCILALRFFVTGLMLFINMCLVIFVSWYACSVMIWWILGAIIAPNRMLVYASSVFTFLYVLYSQYSNLTTLRQTAIQRLEERILHQVLKAIRNSPVKEAFDAITHKFQDAPATATVISMTHAPKTEVSTGMLMDLSSDDPQKKLAAFEQLSVALGIPRVVLQVVIAFVSRKPQDVASSVRDALDMMHVPAALAPLATQLTYVALQLPVTASDLTHSLYPLITTASSTAQEGREGAVSETELARRQAAMTAHLTAHDDIIVSVVQAALQRHVGKEEFAKLLLTVGTTQIAKTLGVKPVIFSRLIDFGSEVVRENQSGAIRELITLLNVVKQDLPDEPQEIRAAVQLALEALLLATGNRHNLATAANNLLRASGLDKSPIIQILSPLLDSTPAQRSRTLTKLLRNTAETVAEQGSPLLLPGGMSGGAPVTEASRKQWVLKHLVAPVASSLVQMLEIKFTITAEQQNSLLLLLSLIDGDPADVKPMAPEFLRTPAQPHQRSL
jgi:hypothetical protein